MPRSLRSLRPADPSVAQPYQPIPEYSEISQLVLVLQRHLRRIEDVHFRTSSSEPLYMALSQAISATIIYFNAGEVCLVAAREYPGLMKSVCTALESYLSQATDRSDDSRDITLRAVRCYADLVQRASHRRVEHDDPAMSTVRQPLAEALAAVHSRARRHAS